jgi:hypothetical protein
LTVTLGRFTFTPTFRNLLSMAVFAGWYASEQYSEA